MKMGTHKYFVIGPEDTARKLQTSIDEMRKASPTTEKFTLHLLHVEITPEVLALLVQLLNQDIRQPSTSTDKFQWEKVTMERCRFARQDERTDQMMEDAGFISQNDRQLLASTLARRIADLKLSESPEILESVFVSPNLEWTELMLCRMTSFTEASTTLPPMEDFDMPTTSLLEAPISLGKFIIARLLSPQSRLQTLFLNRLNLDDHHFLQIVKMLPTSQLEYLSVSTNNIGREGILALANQLPRIKCLRHMYLGSNAWDASYNSEYHSLAAVRKAALENDSIEFSDLALYDEEIKYCFQNNRVRRLALATANSIPMGLWPLILKKVGSWRRPSSHKLSEYRANKLYSFLHKTPILTSICSSSSLKTSLKRKKKQTKRAKR